MMCLVRTVLFGSALGFLAFRLDRDAGSQSVSTAPVLVSIQVSGPSANLIAGQSQQMTATGSYSGRSTEDLTSSANWSSSDTNIATVSPGGMLIARASGTCSITAKNRCGERTLLLKVAAAVFEEASSRLLLCSACYCCWVNGTAVFTV